MIKLVASLFHSLSNISFCSPSHSLPVSKTVSFCRQIVRLRDTIITRPPPKRIQIAKDCDGSRYVGLVKMETVANSRCFVPFFDLPHYISSLLPRALSLRFLLFISFLWAYWIIKFHFMRFLPALWWAWLCQRNVYATKVNERRQYEKRISRLYLQHSLTYSLTEITGWMPNWNRYASCNLRSDQRDARWQQNAVKEYVNFHRMHTIKLKFIEIFVDNFAGFVGATEIKDKDNWMNL